MKALFLLLALSLGACATTQPTVKAQPVSSDVFNIKFNDGVRIVKTATTVCMSSLDGSIVKVRCYY